MVDKLSGSWTWYDKMMSLELELPGQAQGMGMDKDWSGKMRL